MGSQQSHESVMLQMNQQHRHEPQHQHHDLFNGSTPSYEELSARVKHIEASLAVHELATSGGTSTPLIQQTAKDVVYPPTTLDSDPSRGPLYGFDPDAIVHCIDDIPFVLIKSRLEFHGGFSTLAVMKRDPHLKLVWLSLWESLAAAMKDGNTSTLEALKSIVPPSCTRALQELSECRKLKVDERKRTQAIFDATPNLDALILQELPTHNIIMRLSLRFFKIVYPFIPLISEQVFFRDIDSIIGPSNFSNERPHKLNIRGKYDYATIGLLFLVLRLGFLSLEDRDFQERPEFDGLEGLVISPICVEIAKKCLDTYKLDRKTYSVKVFQLMLMLKIYSNFGSLDDDSEDNFETETQFGALYSVAQSMGLHSDPDTLMHIMPDQNTDTHRVLWKKIWHTVLEMDSKFAVMLGKLPFCQDEDSYTTSLPAIYPGMDQVDMCITDNFKIVDAQTKLYRHIALTCFKQRRPPTALHVVRLIDEVESFIAMNSLSLKQVLNGDSKSFVKAKKVAQMYELNSLLLSLKIILLHHFDQVNNKKKIFETFDDCLTLAMKIINSSLNLFFNLRTYFEPGYKLFIKIAAFDALRKTFMFCTSLLAKLTQCRELVPHNSERAALIEDFHKKILSNMRGLLRLMRGISTNSAFIQKSIFLCRLMYELLKSPTYNFNAVGHKVVELANDRRRVSGALMQEFTAAELPKSNSIMGFIDAELNYLKAKTANDPYDVLRPLVNADSAVNPSGTGNGHFYDPVDGLKKNNGADDHNNIQNYSFGDLFGDDSADFDRLFNKLTPSATSTTPVSTASTLTSEEYASLYGLFEDYNIMKSDSNGMDAI